MTLDKFEGYPDLYYRKKIKVKLDNGQIITAEAYIAQSKKRRKGLKPARWYLDSLLAAEDIFSEKLY